MSDDAFIWIDPARRSGRPCVAGTRVPVDAVASMVWCDGVDAAMHSWDFTRAQVLVACWFVAAYDLDGLGGGVDRPYRVFGHRKWRKRWGEWAVAAAMPLWETRRGETRYDGIPDPPSGAENDVHTRSERATGTHEAEEQA